MIPRPRVSRWHRLQQFTWSERAMLVQALLLLPVIRALLTLVGFARCQTLLAYTSRSTPTGNASQGLTLDRARAAARIVRIAAERGFSRATCLPQSLLLWWLIKRQGAETALHVGVRKIDDRVEAHAWVEYEGVALNDDADVHTRFSPFDRAVVR